MGNTLLLGVLRPQHSHKACQGGWETTLHQRVLLVVATLRPLVSCLGASTGADEGASRVPVHVSHVMAMRTPTVGTHPYYRDVSHRVPGVMPVPLHMCDTDFFQSGLPDITWHPLWIFRSIR